MKTRRIVIAMLMSIATSMSFVGVETVSAAEENQNQNVKTANYGDAGIEFWFNGEATDTQEFLDGKKIDSVSVTKTESYDEQVLNLKELVEGNGTFTSCQYKTYDLSLTNPETYTPEDFDNMLDYIVQNISLDEETLKRYDIDSDGSIRIFDVCIGKNWYNRLPSNFVLDEEGNTMELDTFVAGADAVFKYYNSFKVEYNPDVCLYENQYAFAVTKSGKTGQIYSDNATIIIWDGKLAVSYEESDILPYRFIPIDENGNEILEELWSLAETTTTTTSTTATTTTTTKPTTISTTTTTTTTTKPTTTSTTTTTATTIKPTTTSTTTTTTTTTKPSTTSTTTTTTTTKLTTTSTTTTTTTTTTTVGSWTQPKEEDLVHEDEQIDSDTYKILINTAKTFGINQYKIVWSDTPIEYAYTDPGLYYCMRNGIAYGYGVQVAPSEDISTLCPEMKKLVQAEYKQYENICFRPVIDDDNQEKVLEGFEVTDSAYKNPNGIVVMAINESDGEYYNAFTYSNWYLVPLDENEQDVYELNYKEVYNLTQTSVDRPKYWFTNEELMPDVKLMPTKVFYDFILAAETFNFENVKFVYSEDIQYYAFSGGYASTSWAIAQSGAAQVVYATDLLQIEPDIYDRFIEMGYSEELAHDIVKNRMDPNQYPYYAWLLKDFIQYEKDYQPDDSDIEVFNHDSYDVNNWWMIPTDENNNEIFKIWYPLGNN